MNDLIQQSLEAEELRGRLAAIVASSDDAIISKTLDGVIVTWNEGATRIFGYTAAEAIGKPITIVIPPDRLDEEPKILERLRRGERVDHIQTVRVRKDGALVDISLTVSPIRNAAGEIIGASKIARDITAAEARGRSAARQQRAIPAHGEFRAGADLDRRRRQVTHLVQQGMAGIHRARARG